MGLRLGEPYRLTSSVQAYTAGSFAVADKWESLPLTRVKHIVRAHLRPQLLRVGDLHVYEEGTFKLKTGENFF